jgi:recombination protein RecT
MATPEETGKALQAKQEPQTLQTLIEKSARELGRALPDHMRPERLVRIALTCIRLNPELGRCTPESFLGSLFTAAQIGIEPVAGRAYLLPFNNNRKVGNVWQNVKEVQFVLGYKGLAELFYRHEKAVQLAWGTVHENDDFSYAYGTDAFIKHRPAEKNHGAVKGYYVIAKLQGGGQPFMYMSHADCIEHGKKHSKTYDTTKKQFNSKSPWATSEDSMCLKTVMIQLMKLLPLSVELQRAVATDESSREYRSGIDDALDLPDTTDWTGERDITPEAEEITPENATGAAGGQDGEEVKLTVQETLDKELSAYCAKWDGDPDTVMKSISEYKGYYKKVGEIAELSDARAGIALEKLRKMDADNQAQS